MVPHSNKNAAKWVPITSNICNKIRHLQSSTAQHQEGGEDGTDASTRLETNTNSTLTTAPWRRRDGNGDEASEVSRVSTVSKVTNVSKASKVSKVSKADEVSKASEVSKVSKVSKVRKVSEVS